MYVIFVIDLASRKVEVAGICRQPDGSGWTKWRAISSMRWTASCEESGTSSWTATRCTRGSFGSSHPSRDQGSATSGEEPEPDAFAERFVLSVRSECLDRIIPLGDWHLRHAVSEYLKHYHQERNHQGAGECADRFVAGSQRQLQGASPPTAGRAPQLLPPRSGLKESTEYRHSTAFAICLVRADWMSRRIECFTSYEGTGRAWARPRSNFAAFRGVVAGLGYQTRHGPEYGRAPSRDRAFRQTSAASLPDPAPGASAGAANGRLAARQRRKRHRRCRRPPPCLNLASGKIGRS